METGSVKTLLDERGRLSKPFFLVFLVSSFSIVLSSCNTTSAGFDYEPMRARFVLETDGNGTLLARQQYHFTDFPLEQIRLFFVDNTLLLPSEY